MLTVRLAGVILGAGAMTFAPVVTPVWAAPHPVAPTVHRTPLAGVDDTALRIGSAAARRFDSVRASIATSWRAGVSSVRDSSPTRTSRPPCGNTPAKTA